jgi:proteasome lid subunit RPN8/RPN11
MRLVLSYKVWDSMVKHGEEDYPSECCGFFFGKDGEVRKITHAERTPNIQTANRKRRFRIDPLEYRKAEKFAAENNLDFLGVYHSHPDHPAELDLRSTPLDGALTSCDVACVVTAHPTVDYGRVVGEAPLVVDFRGATRGIEATNLVQL